MAMAAARLAGRAKADQLGSERAALVKREASSGDRDFMCEPCAMRAIHMCEQGGAAYDLDELADIVFRAGRFVRRTRSS